MRLRATLIAVTTSAALVLAGCGLPTPPGTTPAAGGAAGNGAPVNTRALGLPGLSGLTSGCLGIGVAYASLMLALIPTAFKGAGTTFDTSSIDATVAQLRSNIPAELRPDIDVIAAAAKSASGKTLAEAGEVFGKPEVSKATDDINNWLDKNCGGS